MRPEILSEFLWGPPISRGVYRESQRVLWSSGTTSTADVQDWHVSMSAARTREHQPLQGLVLKTTRDAKVLALRWAVDRPGRPGWVVHGVRLPKDTPTADALTLAGTLRLDDAQVEAAYKRQADPPRVPARPPHFEGIDLGVVEGIRRAVLDGVTPVAVVGTDEPHIRGHIAAAMATLPATVTTGTTLSTLEGRAEPGLDLVGVIEPLWSGRRALAEEFAQVLRIGGESPRPVWLAGALGSDGLSAYLRTARSLDEFRSRERAVVDFVEHRAYSRELVHALLRRGELSTLRGRIDVGAEIARVLEEGRGWALRYLSGHPDLEQDLAGTLAHHRGALSDELLGCAVQAMSPGARRAFWAAIAPTSHQRPDVHPGCASGTCPVLAAFDAHVAADPAMLTHLQAAAPGLLPMQLRPRDHTLRAALRGEAPGDGAASVLDGPDAAALIAQGVAEELRVGAQPDRLAARLLTLLNSRPDVEEHVHAILLGGDDTFEFAAGAYLETLVTAIAPDEQPSVMLQRVFRPGSAAYRQWGVPAQASAYLAGGHRPTDRGPLARTPEVALVELLLGSRQSADELLGSVLVRLPRHEAADLFWRHRPGIARQYAIRSGSPLWAPAPRVLRPQGPRDSRTVRREKHERAARRGSDTRRIAPLAAASFLLAAALSAAGFVVVTQEPTAPPRPAVSRTTPEPTATGAAPTEQPPGTWPCAPPYMCPPVDPGSASP